MVVRLGDNYLTFTLNEKVTLLDAEFILVFVNMTTNKKTACKLGIDLSGFPSRYNSFLITIMEDPEPLDQQIELHEYGFHRYFIYETADADTFDYDNVDTLDLETMTGLVEQGMFRYLNLETEPPYYANVTQSIPHYGR